MPYFRDKTNDDPYRSQSAGEIFISIASFLFGPFFVGLNIVLAMRLIDATSVNQDILGITIILSIVTFVAFLATKPDLKKYFSMIGLGFAPFILITVLALYYASATHSRWDLVTWSAVATGFYFLLFAAGSMMKEKPVGPPPPKV